MPAIVGGGVGDIEEVLCAGRTLARAGFRSTLYRRAGVPLPPGVDGPWAWPPLRRATEIRPRAPRALTIAPAWGVTCAPEREGPLGRPGPWAGETADIEDAYGAAATAHVSLEEFGRTLTPLEESTERFREGGVRSREMRTRVDRARAAGEVATYRRAYRTFRAFDRPNVLHLYATFRYDRRFAAEFPEAVQTGPLWPGRRPRAPPRAERRGDWVWYASPASAEAIAPEIVRGLRHASPPPRLVVRTPRAWGGRGPLVSVRTAPVPADRWWRQFGSAAVRVVTGSRSLLEALEVGGPFLYFNGTLGTGGERRRHRPEKILGFLELARSARWPADLVRDLADFSRGRRVAAVVARAARHEGGWARFPPPPPPQGFAPGSRDAGTVLVRFARALATDPGSSSDLVATARRRSQT
ncbi:MAG TPA: hypothetical protein VEH10_04435 [Thermoplasmata archaeon]|nr:hypothetical protein [Thermoplasmata archaeon]